MCTLESLLQVHTGLLLPKKPSFALAIWLYLHCVLSQDCQGLKLFLLWQVYSDCSSENPLNVAGLFPHGA